MLPKNVADYRTLLWVAMAVVLVAVQYANSHLLWVFLLAIPNAYFAMCCGIIAHNHNHCPIFPSQRMNRGLGHLLSLFYGYPTFVWVPTHNLNHHKHVNRAGDATITWRFSERHTFWTAATYFFVSAYFQSGPIREYIDKARAQGGRVHRQIVTQAVSVIVAHVALLGLGIAL